MNLIIFIIGALIGGLIGMTTLCLVQINRDTEEELRKTEEKHNEKE